MLLFLERPFKWREMLHRARVRVEGTPEKRLKCGKTAAYHIPGDRCILHVDHAEYPVYADGDNGSVRLMLRTDGMRLLPYCVPVREDGIPLPECFARLPDIWNDDMLSQLAPEMRHVCYARRALASDTPDELLLESGDKPCIEALEAIGAHLAAAILQNVAAAVPEAKFPMDDEDEELLWRVPACAEEYAVGEWDDACCEIRRTLTAYALRQGIL